MANEVQIFVASCGKAKELAKILRSRLEMRKVGKVVLWFEKSTFQPGSSTLEGLIGQCKEADFAVILLTEDDLLIKNPDLPSKHETRIARDNCIYEAGLFTGGLGLDPKRCFLVSLLGDDKAMPTDLLGITVINVDREEGKDVNADWFEDNCDKVVSTIEDAVKTLGPLLQRLRLTALSPKQLLEREQPRTPGSRGHLEGGDSVVVNSSEPIEEDLGFAKVVMQNIQADVKYRYFFNKGTSEWAQRFVALIRNLVVAGVWLNNAEWRNRSNIPKDQFKQCLTEGEREAMAALEEMKLWLHIYLLPEHRLPLQCCVHNAQSDTNARCYLRYKPNHQVDFFLEWSDGLNAQRIANDLLALIPPTAKREGSGTIFRSTTMYNLDAEGNQQAKELREQVQILINKMFPASICERVRSACFGPT